MLFRENQPFVIHSAATTVATTYTYHWPNTQHMGQAIGTTIVKLTGGEGLGLGLEPTEFIQGSSPSLASVYPYTLPGLLE